ncbi:MAG: radical SAM family heme chaperone HemW [Akkermansia sp.]
MHLYIHIPFCHRECPYCAFYKHTPGNTRLRAFVDALLMEAKLRLPADFTPTTIFMGGGTPSMLSPAIYERLAIGLHQQMDLSQVQEWTIEANPATFDLEKAKLWKRYGATRISMGVQSFDAKLLGILGREHTPETAKQSVQILRAAGFEQINIDLMFSLPTQSIEQWQDTLHQAIALDVEHISTYNLTLEEDTPFFQQFGADATDEETDVAMFTMADELLTASGYRHYEISNFARHGCRSIHNLACWQGKDYYGIGPSACATVDGQRIENHGDTQAYISALELGQLPPHTVEPLHEQERHAELIALALRTDEGLPPALIRPQDEGYLQSLVEEGLAQRGTDGSLILNLRGRLLADEIALGLI